MPEKIKHLHFMGIGGIGMSALAQITQKEGCQVSGCDTNIDQKTVHDLQALGCSISHGNNGQYCSDQSIDTVVYSSAINKEDPEFLRAQQRNISIVHRSEILRFLMSSRTSLAVAGTHGKTTTSSILSHILLEANIDPTILIGGHLNSINNNAHYGKSKFLVAEADESDRSFLNLLPTLAVVTNINFDHAETYKDLDDVKQTFQKFFNLLPSSGTAIVCGDDKNIQSLIPSIKAPVTTYGFNESCDWQIIKHTLQPNSSTFYLKHTTKTIGPINFPMPGIHNILNSVAAFIVANRIDVAPKTIVKTLATFAGVDRRFTFKGTYNGATIIDDYGHHPAEIRNALAIARAQTTGKLRVLFQPHRYSRTQKLWNEFLTMFLESNVDELIITDIYPASEQPIKNITSQNFVADLRKKNPQFKTSYLPFEKDFSTLLAHLKGTLAQDDILMLQGAGKVNAIADKLIL
jgi:UDP-N-acetylmuramate--alanine ligase